MRLLETRVLVLRKGQKDKTDGGIYIPEQSQEKRQSGKVVLVGEKADQSLLGKSIIFDPNCGSKLDYDGKEHLLIFESDIWSKNKK